MAKKLMSLSEAVAALSADCGRVDDVNDPLAGKADIPSTLLPDGYVKTGSRDGYPVCCREIDFVRFTGGIATNHLGFVFKNGELIPLED